MPSFYIYLWNMHINRGNDISYNAIVTVSNPKIRLGLISALIYEQYYSFLITYHHGKVPERMVNWEMKVSG